MLRFVILILMILLLVAGPIGAQTPRLEAGDPPVITLITISPPNEEGIVTITGAPGAVFPSARLAIRNLYTEEVVYTNARINGAFDAEIFGPGNTPFWISPVSGAIPNTLQNIPGALPGGPGTIIYGPFPETRAITEAATQIALDGNLADWASYPQGATVADEVYILLNQESLYFGFDSVAEGTTHIQLVMTIDRVTYEVTINLSGEQSASVRRIAPDVRDLDPIFLALFQSGERVEVRFRIEALRRDAQVITLNRVLYLDETGVELSSFTVDQTLEALNEFDGIARMRSLLTADFTRFTIGGPVAEGASRWSARARMNTLNITEPEQPIVLEMDVTVASENLPENIINLPMVGRIGLQPVTAQFEGSDHAVPVAALGSNSGWSTIRTASGLAIDNLSAFVPIAEVEIPQQQVVRRSNSLVFAMDFEFTLPPDLPPGLYVPVFQGYAQIGAQLIPWEQESIFGTGTGISRIQLNRMPVILNVGEVTENNLFLTLFYDNPSEGTRGLLPVEDQEAVALSNRVRFDSPTYILPPRVGGNPVTYPIEPYLLNLTPNSYDSATAPLIPFLFPGGRLNVQVIRPDGTTDDLGGIPILQNQLSTDTVDERERFGEASPLNAYRLTTLNPLLTEYTFDQYGEYQIKLTGQLEDVWGNTYNGGGTYLMTVAELLDITPGVLPGTPFTVGDTLNPVVHIAPGLAAEITANLRIFPLSGGEPIEHTLSATANPYGYAMLEGEPITFDTPGEYVIDYEARYTDVQGRLWAASLRSAGVIDDGIGEIIAHGRRGAADIATDLTPAWFNRSVYSEVIGANPNTIRPYAPYHSGDIAWLADAVNNRGQGLIPTMTAQDRVGVYESWLSGALNSREIVTRGIEDSLPLVMLSQGGYGVPLAPDQLTNEAYFYFTAARPGVTGRQFVQGAEDGGLAMLLDPDDRSNDQIGAGVEGARPGDYFFLFGGLVVRNAEAETAEISTYASLAVVIDPESDEAGVRVYPPGRGMAGGGDSGPLLVFDEEAVDTFFHSTGVQPGDSLFVGDTLSIAGQIAPTLPSQVSVKITAPGGDVRRFEGVANPTGYYYDPANDFEVDEPGVWSVEVTVQHEGMTSVGEMMQPAPVGGVLGADSRRFSVYVLPRSSELLPWAGEDLFFPQASIYNFSFPVPQGWTNVRAYRTLTIPGYVLLDGQIDVTGSSVTYTHNPLTISRAYPNFEIEARFDGPAISDPLTLTMTLTGTDTEGRFQIRNRQITLRHNRMLSLPGDN